MELVHNLSSLKADAGESRVLGQSGLHNKLLLEGKEREEGKGWGEKEKEKRNERKFVTTKIITNDPILQFTSPKNCKTGITQPNISLCSRERNIYSKTQGKLVSELEKPAGKGQTETNKIVLRTILSLPPLAQSTLKKSKSAYRTAQLRSLARNFERFPPTSQIKAQSGF